MITRVPVSCLDTWAGPAGILHPGLHWHGTTLHPSMNTPEGFAGLKHWEASPRVLVV